MATQVLDPANTPWDPLEFPSDTTFTAGTALPELLQLPVFSIRNGDPSDAKSMLIKATIPTPFHWVPLSNVVPAQSVKAVEGYIKSHLEHLEVNQPANSTAALRRKMAICMGVARAVNTSMYSLVSGDFIPGELTQSLLAARQLADGSFEYAPRATLAAERKTRLNAALALTALEKAVVASLLMSSIGIVPLQGYSLIMTQHHYLSAENNQSRRAYAVVEKQFWKGTEVAAWFNDDLTAIQDVMWHKSCHPVSLTVKEQMATDSRVAAMVRDAGAGSAASRLPAVEPEVRAANSYKTLLATVSPMFELCGGELKYDLIQTAVNVVKEFPVNMDNPPRPLGLPGIVPASVVNRSTARQWLGDIVQRNSDKAAYCFGFYCALSDQNQTLGGAAGTDTLKTSNSLTKLRTQSYAAFVSGQQFFADYQAARAAMRAAGQFLAPKFEVE